MSVELEIILFKNPFPKSFSSTQIFITLAADLKQLQLMTKQGFARAKPTAELMGRVVSMLIFILSCSINFLELLVEFLKCIFIFPTFILFYLFKNKAGIV